MKEWFLEKDQLQLKTKNGSIHEIKIRTILQQGEEG